MKAVVYKKMGLSYILENCEVEQPVPTENEVLVKIHAVSINAADYRSMRMGITTKRNIYGADIAGTVEAIGKSVTKFKVGDEVFGDIASRGFGGFAEYAAAPEELLALKPSAVSFETAAAVPMAALTALQALRDRGNIQAGQKVLVYGAGGGVGTFAVQLARVFGAEVTAVCGPGNVELVRSLGADHVVDYVSEDIFKNRSTYDLILAVNGSQALNTYKRALSPGGVLVVAGGALTQIFKTMLFGGLMSTGGKKLRSISAKASAADLEFIIKLVETGKIKAVIARSYPLEQTADAVKYVSLGHTCGKVIIKVI